MNVSQNSFMVGALRAALARDQGWTSGPWGECHKQILGDGPDLAGLSFSGPFLLRVAVEPGVRRGAIDGHRRIA